MQVVLRGVECEVVECFGLEHVRDHCQGFVNTVTS
jgi:hypothetical protein